MKIFIDSGDTAEIKEAHDMGLIDGVTTNPTLAAKSGKNFKELILEIAKIVDGPISAEVVSTKAEEMITEGDDIASWHKNIVVKVPLIPEGLKAVKYFSGEWHQDQRDALLHRLAGAAGGEGPARRTSARSSGGLDDISTEGMQVIRDIRTIYDNYGYETQILTAMRAFAHAFPRGGAHRQRCHHRAVQGADAIAQASADR